MATDKGEVIFQDVNFESIQNIESKLMNIRLKEKGFLIIELKVADATANVKLDFLGLLSCRTGEVTVKFDSSSVHVVKPDQLVFLPVGKSFNITVSEDFSGNILCVKQSMLYKTLRLDSNFREIFQLLKNNPVVDVPAAGRGSKMTFIAILDNLKLVESSAFYSEMVQSLFQFILYAVLNLAEARTEIKKTTVVSHREMLFNNFLMELGASSPVEREVAYYADKLCVTPKYLSSICKHYGGRNASDFITSFATEEIRNLLEFSTLSIKEIAIKLKFPSISFFGRYVKKNLGLSPSDYRKSLG